MTAIADLIRAVEAGNDNSELWYPALEDRGYTAMQAFHGSLDAALALHEALLPRWCVDDMSENGRAAGHPWGIRLAYWNATNPSKNKWVDAGWGADKLPDRNPARAWLLAILRALEAQEKNDD